jgi:hypothetical protein
MDCPICCFISGDRRNLVQLPNPSNYIRIREVTVFRSAPVPILTRLRRLTERHTGAHLAKVIADCLTRFGLEEKVLRFFACALSAHLRAVSHDQHG